MKKRIINILASAVLMLSLAACGNQDTTETTGMNEAMENNTMVSGTIYTGTVSAISEESITVSTETGEVVIPLTEDTTFERGFGMGGQQFGEMGEVPDGMMDESKDFALETPPEGDHRDEPGGDRPELPEGESWEDVDAGAMESMVPMESMEAIEPMEPMDGEMQTTLTYEDVAVGDTVTVMTDDTGNGISVMVSFGETDNMKNPNGMNMKGDIEELNGTTSAGDGDDAAEE